MFQVTIASYRSQFESRGRIGADITTYLSVTKKAKARRKTAAGFYI
jgi:hypothetical protein